MKYLCLLYQNELKRETLSESDSDALEHEESACRGDLARSGHFVAVLPLQPVRTATTIRVRHGVMSITDGPSADTKEQLSGCYLIEARDLNEAIRVAGKLPAARLGSVEVRPLKVSAAIFREISPDTRVSIVHESN